MRNPFTKASNWKDDEVAALIVDRDDQRSRRILAESRVADLLAALADARAAVTRFETAFIEATTTRLHSLDEMNSTLLRTVDTNPATGSVGPPQPLDFHSKPSPAKTIFNKLMVHEIKKNQPLRAETPVN